MFGTGNVISSRKNSLSRALAHWFPTPRILAPLTAGIDISDTSIKWIVLSEYKEGLRVESYGQEPLSAGIVEDGAIKDEAALAKTLKRIKSQLPGVRHAHAALPEEAAFVFSMHVPEKTAREQILSMIEFELDGRVPLAPKDTVYDFNVIEEKGEAGEEIGVSVFPREFAESYARAFEMAGIELLSLELEARSIARAISSGSADEPITLSVDFGKARTGFAVLKRGIPIFTSTVGIGGETMTQAVAEKLSLSPEEAQAFKNDQGLLAEGGTKSPGLETLVGTASALADEILKHFHYWDTRKNEKGSRVTPVGRVLMVGGSANLKGITDYVAARVKAPTERPNVWQNVCSFEEYIPPIDRRTSLQYATAIGLALRGM